MGLADIDKDLGLAAIDRDLAQPAGYVPPGAIPGSPGTNPLTPSWAVPFAGQPQMGGREATGRLVGAAGYTATGGIAGLPGAAARIGVGATQGGIQNGVQGAVTGGLLNALIEGTLPVAGAFMKAAPWPLSGLRNLLPMRPEIKDTLRHYEVSPWVGQSVAPDMTQLMLQGPVLLQRGGAPTINPGPFTNTTREITQPARAYMPNLPPFVRALNEYLAGNTAGQFTGGGQ